MEEDVDIISMSWAIDKETTPGPNDNQRLCDAIKTAAKKNILLFCANPDRGPTFKAMDTYPKAADPERVFCIGAATPDGIRWGQIDAQDTSCDYFLPGIELGIQVESTSRKNQHEPPQEWYVLFLPSSLLTSGLTIHLGSNTAEARSRALLQLDWQP